MNNSNKKKSNQLGMPIGTAQAILKKNILYNLLVRFNLNKCYQCGNTIDKVEEIRELLRVNSRRKVAEITGASKTTIARIARGEIYKYI